jgi:hypothetical protein
MHDNRKSAGTGQLLEADLSSSSKSAVTAIDQSFAKKYLEPRNYPCKQLYGPQQWFAKRPTVTSHFVLLHTTPRAKQNLRGKISLVQNASTTADVCGRPTSSYLLNIKYRLQHPSSYYDLMMGLAYCSTGKGPLSCETLYKKE